jgi:hypothetical protein
MASKYKSLSSSPVPPKKKTILLAAKFNYRITKYKANSI